MARDQFIALAWRSGEVSAGGTTALVRGKAGLESLGWRLIFERPGLWVFGFGDHPIRVLPLGAYGGVLIGDLFDAAGEAPTQALSPDGDHGDAGAVSSWLANTHWGRYVALAPDGRHERWGIFRDPLGGLDVLAWQRHDVVVVASDLPEPLLRHLAGRISIDWRMMCGVVAEPPTAQARNLLRGVNAVGPGELIVLGAAGIERHRLWSPAVVARAPCPPGDLELLLRSTVDLCVRSWSNAYGPIIAEVSGGLDSSIVASALIAHGADVKAWLNHHIESWVGDERPFARALATGLGFPLTEIARVPLTVRPEAFLTVAGGPSPSFNAADVDFDETMGQAATSQGARAIVTGQGGDVVFFQMATVDVATDRLRRLGLGGLSWSFLRAIAEWNQVSVWSVILSGMRPRTPGAKNGRTYLSQRAIRTVRRLPPAAFALNLARLPPGKRLQVSNLAYIQVVRGRSRRGEAAAVLHPLLSQPLVELCLRIPSDQLVQGGRARGLARDAFASRLPAIVADRRTKGDMTAFYGHAIAEGLDQIRDFLLDGRLVAEGVVDREILDRQLEVGYLAQAGDYGDVLDLLAIEAWVRVWEARLETVSSSEATGGPINGSRKAKTSAQ